MSRERDLRAQLAWDIRSGRPAGAGGRLTWLPVVTTSLVAASTVFISVASHGTPPAPPPLTAQAEVMPYDLYTHCGVDEAKIGAVYFEAESPLIGTARSAPPGWGNPEQPGTMTLLSSDRVVFHDDLGHEVFFRARPGATTPKLICD